MKMRSFGHMLVVLPLLATLGCQEAGEGDASSQRVPAKELTGLSAKELSKLTELRRVALGDDYASMDLGEYDAAIAAHGSVYKRQLVERIKDSDHITITEHTDRMDFIDEDGNITVDPPFYEYRTVRLTNAQQSAFLSAVKAMEEATVSASSMCIFEPHHRLEFVGDQGEPSQMSICFKCGQVRWNEVELVHPEGLFGALQYLIDLVGIEADKDWKELAKKRSERGEDGDAEEAF